MEQEPASRGHRHGSRTRSLTGTFGPIEIAVPRARLTTAEGTTAEWKSQALRWDAWNGTPLSCAPPYGAFSQQAW